jgi:hypothetical protein
VIPPAWDETRLWLAAVSLRFSPAICAKSIGESGGRAMNQRFLHNKRSLVITTDQKKRVSVPVKKAESKKRRRAVFFSTALRLVRGVTFLCWVAPAYGLHQVSPDGALFVLGRPFLLGESAASCWAGPCSGLKETLINSCPPYEPPIFRLTSATLRIRLRLLAFGSQLLLKILPRMDVTRLRLAAVFLRFLPVSGEKSIVSSGKRNESEFP